MSGLPNTVGKNYTIESLRGLSSIYVVIGHKILATTGSPVWLRTLFSFGQEAVIIFFLISGYVIHSSWEKSSEKNLTRFFIRRLRRIYFPFIIALLVPMCLYPGWINWTELAGNLLMLQDFKSGKPGVFVSGFMGNTPLWSLSYEWGFYLMFPFVYPALKQQPRRVFFIGLLSFTSLVAYILFPNHLFLVPAYFMIWWAGLELSDLSLRNKPASVSFLKPVIVALSANIILLIAVCAYTHLFIEPLKAGIYPAMFLRHFAFALIFILVSTAGDRILGVIKKLIYPFHHIAPISYGLYIFHYTILITWVTAMGPATDLFVKIIVLFALAYITEIKLQPIVNKLIK